ncbi:hypothetical protein L226DRAFT_569119 [Lentinus tigrinus ALCF2SS1-7]|uniref:uncharacterized protein n=1 Tax=Lentinus tigrinus ALCF2SS1-7 TaxID=1328758 RepID=UPI001165EDEE|nr:hypothetical protein L226DRAFT_569119 [Lentinus tigrinus ALCF2SS1-7]
MSPPFLLHPPRLRHERSPLQPSSTIFVAIHRRSTWPLISDALAVYPFLLAIAYRIAQARSTSRECRARGWAEVADIEEVSDNGSIVSTFGVSDRRRSVVKGYVGSGNGGAGGPREIGTTKKGITRGKTGSLIKADDEEQEDDFEDEEDDVGKAREDSQIARGVPGAADRSLPPVGRERSGDGEDGFRTRRMRLKSKTHRKLKTKDDLARLGGIIKSQQACSGTANRRLPPAGRSSDGGDGFRINGIAKTDGDEQDSRARTRLKGKAQEQGRPGKTWRDFHIATGVLRYCQQRLPAGREAKVGRFSSFPREGRMSWRIPLRGPRDEYLPARCLGSEDLRYRAGEDRNYWRKPTDEQEQDEGRAQDGENGSRHWKMLMADGSPPAGREVKVSGFMSFSREGLRSWRIPLRGPRDEYLPTRYPGSKDLGQCAGMRNQNALQALASDKASVLTIPLFLHHALTYLSDKSKNGIRTA